jgi:phospholipase C
MGCYGGNTVTGLWNYAQHFAMSDSSYDTTFGSSTTGAHNFVAGEARGFAPTSTAVTANPTVIGDSQPTGDKCDTRDTRDTATPSTPSTPSTPPHPSTQKNNNVCDLLNAKGTTWGWFHGGFADCAATDRNIGGVSSAGLHS